MQYFISQKSSFTFSLNFYICLMSHIYLHFCEHYLSTTYNYVTTIFTQFSFLTSATSEWTQWSPCSLTCGSGDQQRSKSAQISTDGKRMSFAALETRKCNTQECPGIAIIENCLEYFTISYDLIRYRWMIISRSYGFDFQYRLS